jgi:phage host-nuclease inhibitor protein Gam
MPPTATTRIRRTTPVVATRADAERILGELAAATADRARFQAELDAKLTEVRREFEHVIEDLNKDIEGHTGLLQAWAEANPDEFGEKKSVELLHGRLGFRTGNPKLKTLSGWTWDRVKETLARSFSGHIRTKTEVDKEGLLAARQRHELDDNDLRQIGVKVVQDEAFFIEPKVDAPAA